MGIPSYYKRLADSIKGLVVPHRSSSDFSCGTLLFDFNCMIYQIIRERPFPGADGAELWEQECLQSIVDYTVSIWKEVGKPKSVFIAIDGVVPMAKIRQQRLRRFKSVWTRESDGTVTWDTNAITPGTAFMEKLSVRLSQLCKTHGWRLSDASEPGEGEQKCMEFWRSSASASSPIVLYGLDADLILLCLLTRASSSASEKPDVWCLRESAEWEKSSAPFMRLSIHKLAEVLESGNKLESMSRLQWMADYIAAMSFLGNDFVPHGISLKIREGGHDRMLHYLKELHLTGNTLTNCDGGVRYNIQGVRWLVERFAAEEEDRLKDFIRNKRRRIHLEDTNLQPCSWAVEEAVLTDGGGSGPGLRPDWQKAMLSEWFGEGVTWSNVCLEYTRGLQWILDYYTGQAPIAKTWLYPWSLPPAWSELLHFLRELDTMPSAPDSSKDEEQIQPKEQLAMVLPLESWGLIREKQHIQLPKLLPHFWPKRYGFFSAGKIFMWECEAELPLLHIATLRAFDWRQP